MTPTRRAENTHGRGAQMPPATMPPRKKGAVRAAAARREAKKPSGKQDGDVYAARHQQVTRNAYIIAQSQLLQLAKQMEFDVDLTPWENEVDERMSEFWQQTNENVDEFCARMRYVKCLCSASRDKLPHIVADVVKSPRKRPEHRSPLAPKVVQPSPKSPSTLRSAHVPADASHSDDDILLSKKVSPRKSSQTDRLLAPSSGNMEESQPKRDEVLDAEQAPAKSAHFTKSPDRLPGMPTTTPGTGLRTKRTLSSAVLRSTKKPTEPNVPAAPAPSSQPPSKTPANRFRSSFLNKSLRKAIEERQGSGGADPDESELEPSPFDDSQDELVHTEQPESVQEKDTTDTKPTDTKVGHPPSPPRVAHPGNGPLDALRTRLENVRRTSTASSSHTVPSIATAMPARTAEPRRVSTARPVEEPKVHSAAPEAPARPSTPPKSDAAPASRSTTTPTRPNATPSRIPLALRSPARVDRPGSRLDRTPSRLDRPMSRAEGPRPISKAQERPASRADLLRSPMASGLPRSPSRMALTNSPSRGAGPSPSRAERLAQSPARPLHASPFRAREGKTALSASTQPESTKPKAARSPGKLQEEHMSPFRATERPSQAAAPASSAAKALSPRMENGAPSPLPPARPASPKLTVPPSPVERETAPTGFGARIKGLLGFQAQLAKPQPPSPKMARPASALASTSPTRTSRPSSPERPVQTALGFHDDIDELDERQVQAAVGMPGAFTKPPRPKEAVPRPAPRKVLAPARPAPKQASSSRPSLQTRPASVVSVRPPSRAPPASRLSQARASPAPSRMSTTQAYTYDAEGKRRKLSQQPLQESTNHEERVSTESALKSKLTTSTSSASTVHLSKVGHTTVRPPTRPPTSAANRTWSKPGSARSSALSSTNVFQQQPAVPEPEAASAEELPDVQSEYSDSEDEASIKKRKLEPSWTRGRELEDLLLQQSTVDPDEIFGFQLGPVPLDTMLPPRKGDRRRARKRTSSANWNGPDGLAQWEIDRYNERMGIQTHRGGAL